MDPDPLSLRIPAEIVYLILSELYEKTDLLNSRLISKMFMQVASPLGFRRLTLSRAPESLAGIARISDSPLAKLVSEVVLEEVEFPLKMVPLDQPSSDDPFRVGMALYIPKFHNLTTLIFSFPDFWEFENNFTPPGRNDQGSRSAFESDITASNLALHQQERFFHMLGRCNPDLIPPTMNTIVIHNLMSFWSVHFDIDKLRPFLASLTNFKVDIQIVPDLRLEELFQHPPREHDPQFIPFWREFDLLLDAACNLTSLSLTSDADAYNTWGSVNIFPRLQNLSLNGFLFAYSYLDGDVVLRTCCLETFIILHHNTLQHLLLSDCFIDIMAEFRSWAEIFREFERNLGKLRSFDFQLSNGNGYATMSMEEPGGHYINANATNEPNFADTNMSEEEIKKADKLALLSLQNAIKSRNE
ncbi:hypothetical protein JR316_0012389 [Psilocybe cubensis]|uniref:Uncharacterized protein n=2 Tax=Psilocybe cubensis TaxID=181762 RepID=A0ACB8GHV1_PSICU|nr:hypothetical protein JR316_0012389 [Psilocybe cubensis]KAH9475278.1 hypothetical protein JR316_0012389 [Psilocybe cubensis]